VTRITSSRRFIRPRERAERAGHDIAQSNLRELDRRLEKLSDAFSESRPDSRRWNWQ
jgi:hypothetical protein